VTAQPSDEQPAEPQSPGEPSDASSASEARRRARVQPNLVDTFFTIPFLFAFGLILFVFDPLQRIARLFGQRPQEVVAGVMQFALMQALRLCGSTFMIERSLRIQPHTPYLLVANHQSMFDIPLFGALLFTSYPKYISKAELGKWIPSISYNLRRGGNVLIDRGDRSKATEAIRELGRIAQARGVSAVIYPEGTRARTGELGRFRPAGTVALLEAAPDLEVVPVTIDNSWKLMRWGMFPVPFGTYIRIHLGDPIARSKDESPYDILNEVRAQLEADLERWRAE
jgi:1-acyl-sn-glycerol-3-phosphate acyltransferase